MLGCWGEVASELLAERVVRSGQSSRSEHPSSQTLGESLPFLGLSFPFGKKGTELAGSSVTGSGRPPVLRHPVRHPAISLSV